jgi:hypothetical protein
MQLEGLEALDGSSPSPAIRGGSTLGRPRLRRSGKMLWRRARELAMPNFHRHFVNKLMTNFWTTLASGKAAKIITNLQHEEEMAGQVSLSELNDERDETPAQLSNSTSFSDSSKVDPPQPGLLGGLFHVMGFKRSLKKRVSNRTSRSSQPVQHTAGGVSQYTENGKGVQSSLLACQSDSNSPTEDMGQVQSNKIQDITSFRAGMKTSCAKPGPVSNSTNMPSTAEQSTKNHIMLNSDQQSNELLQNKRKEVRAREIDVELGASVAHSRRPEAVLGDERHTAPSPEKETEKSQWRVNTLALDMGEEPVALDEARVCAQLKRPEVPVHQQLYAQPAEEQQLPRDKQGAQSGQLSTRLQVQGQSVLIGKSHRCDDSQKQGYAGIGETMQSPTQPGNNSCEPDAFGSFQSFIGTSNQGAAAAFRLRRIPTPEFLEPGEIAKQAPQRSYGHSSTSPLPMHTEGVEQPIPDGPIVPSTWKSVRIAGHRDPLGLSRTAVWPSEGLRTPKRIQLSKSLDCSAYQHLHDHLHQEDATMLASPPLVHWGSPTQRVASTSPPSQPRNALSQSAVHLPFGVDDIQVPHPASLGHSVACDTSPAEGPFYQHRRQLHISDWPQGSHSPKSGIAPHSNRWPSSGHNDQHNSAERRRF